MKFEKREYFLIALVALAFIIGLYLYPYMPDVVPSHWGADGEADGYSCKAFSLFFLPAIILVIYIMLTYIPRIAIYKENIEKFKKAYFRFKIAFVVFMFALYIATLVQTFRPFSMNLFILPGLAFLFFFTGNLLMHAKRNFFIGFRTPWTLSSEKVWNKTNKAAAKFFTVYAFIVLLGLFIPSWAMVFILVPLAIGIPWLIYYSYLLFQKVGLDIKIKKPVKRKAKKKSKK